MLPLAQQPKARGLYQASRKGQRRDSKASGKSGRSGRSFITGLNDNHQVLSLNPSEINIVSKKGSQDLGHESPSKVGNAFESRL